MPIGGVPSDDWKVNRILGPYAKEMDKDELKEFQKTIKKNRKSDEESNEDFKMPF